jgi:hypothetical protein
MVQFFFTAPLFTKEIRNLLKSFYFILHLFCHLNVIQQMKQSNVNDVIIPVPQHSTRWILVKKDDLPKYINKLISSCPFDYASWKEPTMTYFRAILDPDNLHCFIIWLSFHFKHDAKQHLAKSPTRREAPQHKGASQDLPFVPDFSPTI